MWNSPPPKPSFGPLPQPPVWEPCSLTSVQPVPHPPHLAANFYHHWMVHRLSLLKNNNDKQNFPFSLFFPAVKATFPSTSAQAQFSGALPVSRCFPSSPQLYPAKPPCLPSSKWCAKVVNNPGSLFFFWTFASVWPFRMIPHSWPIAPTKNALFPLVLVFLKLPWLFLLILFSSWKVFWSTLEDNSASGLSCTLFQPQNCLEDELIHS